MNHLLASGHRHAHFSVGIASYLNMKGTRSSLVKYVVDPKVPEI
jgi:hypothetical protein